MKIKTLDFGKWLALILVFVIMPLLSWHSAYADAEGTVPQ